MIFLIEYDRTRGELVDMKCYADAERDQAENLRLEKELALHRQGVQREIVVLQAVSEEALRQTHSRYFADLATLAQDWS